MKKVLKFGGSSMADANQFRKIKAIVEADPSRTAIIVSAPGKRFSGDHKVTDMLYLCYAHLQYGMSCDNIFDLIKERFTSIHRDLGLKCDIEGELNAIRAKMDNGITQEELVSRGEYLAAVLMADFLGFEFIDAASWLQFKPDGSVDQSVSYAELKKRADNRCVVIPGFYGALPNGQIKTFTRGGSDISGAYVAAALGADVYENWTDVPGILMADPRIVENPQPIAQVTYTELRELSYAGAQVLHESTILPVRKKHIPINIRNTNAPEHPGTMIQEHFDESPSDSPYFITGIAGRKNFNIVTVNKIGISSEVGALRQILEIFDRYNVPVEYFPACIDSYSMVISADKAGPNMLAIMMEIEKAVHPDEIKITENIAVVAAVGRHMNSRPGISGQICAALGNNGINIRMISQSPEELNIVLGVHDKDLAETIRVLYKSFVKS